MVIELPLTSDAAQTVVTQLGETKYQLDVQYNDRSNRWTLTLTDFVTQTLIAASLPLVLGQSLLEPYNLAIGHLLVVDTSGRDQEAGPDDLGGRVKVYWFSDEEAA